MKKLFVFFVFSVLSFNFIACSDDDDSSVPVVNLNLAQTLAADSDYATLVAALELTGLTSTFTGSDQYTVFAPTNAAFQALLDSNPDWNSLDDIPEGVLTQVLLNHVVSGSVESTDLSTGYVNTLAYYEDQTSENLSMYINTADGVVINGGMQNGGATVSQADITASNGVIHEVNSVIALPTVVTFVVADSRFSSLATSLTTATPNTDFVAVLTGPNSPYTVFAPTNDAFQALLDSNTDWNSLDDVVAELGEEGFTNVLLYHVNDDNLRAEDLSDGLEMNTLFPSNNITFVVPGTDGAAAAIDDATDTNKNIIETNLQASNGVVHAIAGVLLP